jgi:hypothetical protein
MWQQILGMRGGSRAALYKMAVILSTSTQHAVRAAKQAETRHWIAKNLGAWREM